MTFTLYDDQYATSDGMRILLSGLSLRAFVQNPVMLYMHNRGGEKPNGSEVIGKWQNVRLVGKRLLADAVFDPDDPLAQKIANKVAHGFLSGASIGILIKKTSQNPANKITHQTGATITQSVLLEASIVDIPRCANALVNHCFMYSICMNKITPDAPTSTQKTTHTPASPKDAPQLNNPAHPSIQPQAEPTEQLNQQGALDVQSVPSDQTNQADPSEQSNQSNQPDHYEKANLSEKSPPSKQSDKRIAQAIGQCAITKEEGRYYQTLFAQNALLAGQLLQCAMDKQQNKHQRLHQQLNHLTHPIYTDSAQSTPSPKTLRHWQQSDPEALREYLAQLASKQSLINTYEQA